MRYLVLAAAIVFVFALGVLTVLDFTNNGVTFVGVIGLGVVIVCGVGVIGAALHQPRNPPRK
jgi:hypothetical protein